MKVARPGQAGLGQAGPGRQTGVRVRLLISDRR